MLLLVLVLVVLLVLRLGMPAPFLRRRIIAALGQLRTA